MAVLNDNLDEVSDFVGFDARAVIESHLVFRHPVPMEFALNNMRDQVDVRNLSTVENLA